MSFLVFWGEGGGVNIWETSTYVDLGRPNFFKNVVVKTKGDILSAVSVIVKIGRRTAGSLDPMME